MKNKLKQLKKFELTSNEQKQILAGNEYCRSVAYNGEVKTFCSENESLTNSWADVWMSFGGADFPQHST